MTPWSSWPSTSCGSPTSTLPRCSASGNPTAAAAPAAAATRTTPQACTAGRPTSQLLLQWGGTASGTTPGTTTRRCGTRRLRSRKVRASATHTGHCGSQRARHTRALAPITARARPGRDDDVPTRAQWTWTWRRCSPPSPSCQSRSRPGWPPWSSTPKRCGAAYARVVSPHGCSAQSASVGRR